jgi:hypothetical protein
MEELYLDLLKRCVTRTIFHDKAFQPPDITNQHPYSHELRHDGRDWPIEAVTMVGVKRIENLQNLLSLATVGYGIQGDVVECGVWKGGASIFMRGVLVALGQGDRRVWLYDSFQGLPKPSDESDLDLTSFSSYLGIPLEQVQENFREFGLLSEQVKFVPGWFKDTLPTAAVEKIVLLRLDGDMYESTKDTLDHLYDKVSLGGYVVVDDYGCLPMCKRAVDEFRELRKISSPIIPIDWTGVYWQVT